MLLLAGLVLNDQYGFYTSWSDLFGGSSPVVVAGAGASASQALGRPLPHGGPGGLGRAGSEAAGTGSLPRPTQREQSWVVHGPHSGLTGTVDVTLPAGYLDASQATRRYPVIEAFAGYPGTPQVWTRGLSFVPLLDRLAAVGSLAPTIVVSPQLEFPGGTDTECVDGGPGHAEVETWISEDVPQFVAAHLRTRTDRASWSTLGVSMGAWCAALTTMRHPDVFGTAVVLGGYFRPDFDPSYVPFSPTSAEGRRDDLVALARQAPPPVALWVFTSMADGLSYPTSRELLASARSPLSVTSTVQTDSGHRMSVWVGQLPRALTWLAATSSGFSGTSGAS